MDWRKQLATAQRNKPEKAEIKAAVYCLWFYKIGSQQGFTRMGLMTDDKNKARQQLETIYNKPITSLQQHINRIQ